MMKRLFNYESEKGQAFVETVIIFPILVLLIAGIVQFSQISITEQRLLMAARHGVWLMGRGQSTSDVEGEVKEFLVQGTPKFTKDRIRITCSGGNISKVTVSYELHPAPMLRPILGSKIVREGSCSVVVGTY